MGLGDYMNKEIDILINKPIESDLSNWNITDIQIMKSYLRSLQCQLELKDKIIDEIADFASFNDYCPYECFYDEKQDECNKVKKLCNCENCKKDDSKKCWLKYFENEIKVTNK